MEPQASGKALTNKFDEMSIHEIAEELRRRLLMISEETGRNPPSVEVTQASMFLTYEPNGYCMKLTKAEAVGFLSIFEDVASDPVEALGIDLATQRVTGPSVAMEQETGLSLPKAGVPVVVNPSWHTALASEIAIFAMSDRIDFAETLFGTCHEDFRPVEWGDGVKNLAN